VVGSQHPQLVGEQLLKCRHRPGQVASLATPVGDVVAGVQGLGVLNPVEKVWSVMKRSLANLSARTATALAAIW
jgi:hypothetical protein